MRKATGFVWVAVAVASLVGCGGGDASCVTDSDCGEGLCGPNDACQAGETGDPCASQADCQFACGPANQCQLGMEGDPCSLDTQCFFSDGGDTSFECGSDTCEAEPQCVGTVTPCASLTLVSCVETRGCDWVAATSTCSGVAEPCSSQTSVTCDFQAGCSFE